jgi:hypothetical protein
MRKIIPDLFIFMALIALVTAGAFRASATVINALAAVSQTGEPGNPGGGDSKSRSSSSGGPISDVASFGQGWAGFQITPRTSSAGFNGQSAPVTFGAFSAFGSDSIAQGLIEFPDTIHVIGSISDVVEGSIVVLWEGSLTPNATFEQQHFAALGWQTLTAAATASALVENPGFSSASISRNYVASQLGSTNPCSPDPCQVGRQLNELFHLPFEVSDTARNVSIFFAIGANGRRGGSYSFGAAGGALSATRANTTPSLSTGGSFFGIFVDLPEGLSYTADSGYFIQPLPVAVPEPSSLPAIALVFALAGARWRRQKSSAIWEGRAGDSLRNSANIYNRYSRARRL